MIRGDLLKRYPNAVIYAHRASWARKADGSIDPSKERTLVPDRADESAPPRDQVKTPLYEAQVDPDIDLLRLRPDGRRRARRHRREPRRRSRAGSS